MTQVTTTSKKIKAALTPIQSEGKSIGFVPTMGALHEGHLSLIRSAKAENDTVVVSIFVNPTQFNDPDDYRNYPRTYERDREVLEEEGVDFVFMPGDEEMYPGDDRTLLDFNPGYLNQTLEAAFRPGHFEGVATIVKKLFDIVMPDRAYFGQKDYQQLLVIRQLVRTYSLPVKVIGGPVKRESDGLALSSRNILLSHSEREKVPVIYHTLCYYKTALEEQALQPQVCQREAKAYLDSFPEFEVEYFAIRDAETLKDLSETDNPDSAVLLVALHVGKVRLIDNMVAYPALN
jgi:pantoate--beta-alanine ligase